MAKNPKPKIGDKVEMSDLSKLFGVVTKIISNDTVEIRWADKIPDYSTQEKIKNLALIKR